MKKKIVVILLAAVITAGAADYGAAKYKSYSTAKAKESEFSSVLSEVNKSRSAIRNNPASLKDNYVNWYNTGEDKFSENEVNELSKYALENKANKYTFLPSFKVDYDDNKSISNTAAKEDIDELFRLFKYCYGPYGYYGGDKTFKEVQDKILSEISKDKQIKVSDFKEIIRKNLQFITDGHFNIYDSNTVTKYYFQHSFYNYMGSDDYYKDKDGWYTMSGKDKLYVKEIDKSNKIDSYMYHSISDNGQLIYKLSVLKDENTAYSINLNVKFSLNGSDVNKTIKLEKLQPATPDNTSIFKYYDKDNIPVAKMTSFIASSKNDPDDMAFAESGSKMKNKPVSIIDLRGNCGGVCDSQFKWIQNYIGKINPNYYSFNREGSMTIVGKIADRVYKGLNNPGYATPKTPFVVMSPGKKASVMKNDKLLIVLVDKNTVSAAEHFLAELSSMDNVLIVGTNSTGAYLSGTPTMYGLHNSNIPVQLPSALYISPLSSDYEGKGMKPDILVNSKDALDKVVKMVQYYNLNSKTK